MNELKDIQMIDNSSLLLQINRRDEDAFCSVYRLYFDRLYHFTTKQFVGTNVLAEDILHDIFASVWEKKTLKFDTIDHFTGYIYLSIRNKRKDYLIKQQRVDKFNYYQAMNDDSLFSEIVESETLSILSKAIDLLPTECAKVFKMHVEGWSIKEIAMELDKSESTVYNQRKEAVNILKKKISKSAFTLLMTIC